MTEYERIEKAISYIAVRFRDQPDLDAVAKHVHVSPYHFQRMFRAWAGVSPKKFLQYMSLDYAKELLKENRSLEEATFETGLTGTGRLHDLFVHIEAMTPGEYKAGGRGLTVKYMFSQTPFGMVIIAATARGICFLSFTKTRREGLKKLAREYPGARLTEGSDPLMKSALRLFRRNGKSMPRITVNLAGTPFQLKVWAALLSIPPGAAATYKDIARKIGNPRAVRAVGTAVGKNPVPFIIPCHRVIRATGAFGNYGGGKLRKRAILAWEAANAGRKSAGDGPQPRNN